MAFERTDPALSPRYDAALAYAADAHRSQLRKGTRVPYLAHLLAVSALVLEAGGDEDEAIAALLHDAVEDQGAWRLGDIEARFGSRVAGIVAECSAEAKPDQLPGTAARTWRARKDAYLAHLAVASPSALRVSVADKLHNATTQLTDVRRDGLATFDRFNAGVAEQRWYQQALLDAYEARAADVGPLLANYRAVVAEFLGATAPG